MRILNNMLVAVDKKDIVEGVLTIPSGVEIIANNCLKGNNYIKVVNCPDTLKEIGNNAFEDSSVEMINFNEGLLMIGDSAFFNTNIKMAYFPDSLEYLGEYAFSDCKFLQDVKFGHHLKNISRHCFSSTDISYIKLEEGIETIGEQAFFNLRKLRKIDFCSSLKRIGDSAFAESFRTLPELHFNERLLTIEDDAFKYCWIEKLYLPDSLKYIGNGIFTEKLEQISCANVETFELFSEFLMNRYFTGKAAEPHSFLLNIKSLSELTNGMYGDYYFDCKPQDIKFKSYKCTDNSKQYTKEFACNIEQYNNWVNVLKKMEPKIKKAYIRRVYLEKLFDNIENYLIGCSKDIEKIFIRICSALVQYLNEGTQETECQNTIQDSNHEIKCLTNELFNKSKQEASISINNSFSNGESNSQPSDNSGNNEISLMEYDDNGGMWLNGDLVPPNQQQQMAQKGVSLVKKR